MVAEVSSGVSSSNNSNKEVEECSITSKVDNSNSNSKEEEVFLGIRVNSRSQEVCLGVRVEVELLQVGCLGNRQEEGREEQVAGFLEISRSLWDRMQVEIYSRDSRILIQVEDCLEIRLDSKEVGYLEVSNNNRVVAGCLDSNSSSSSSSSSMILIYVTHCTRQIL